MTWNLPALLFMLFALFAIVTLNMRVNRRRGRYHPLVEDLLRRPGESVEKRLDALFEKWLFQSLFLGVILVIGGAGLGQLESGGRLLVGAVVACLVSLLAWMLYRTLNRIREVKPGQICERYTGQELDYLMRDGAFVFHDLPIANGASSYGNIDHVVIGKRRIFAVETKGVSKPARNGRSGSRQSRVTFDGKSLHFPTHSDDAPVKQAIRNAEVLAGILSRHVGETVEVTPVVALPGWYVTTDAGADSRVLVINPKRAKFLKRLVASDEARSPTIRSVIRHVETVARSVKATSSPSDPNGADTHDIWFRPRERETALR